MRSIELEEWFEELDKAHEKLYISGIDPINDEESVEDFEDEIKELSKII